VLRCHCCPCSKRSHHSQEGVDGTGRLLVFRPHRGQKEESHGEIRKAINAQDGGQRQYEEVMSDDDCRGRQRTSPCWSVGRPCQRMSLSNTPIFQLPPTMSSVLRNIWNRHSPSYTCSSSRLQFMEDTLPVKHSISWIFTAKYLLRCDFFSKQKTVGYCTWLSFVSKYQTLTRSVRFLSNYLQCGLEQARDVKLKMTIAAHGKKEPAKVIFFKTVNRSLSAKIPKAFVSLIQQDVLGFSFCKLNHVIIALWTPTTNFASG